LIEDYTVENKEQNEFQKQNENLRDLQKGRLMEDSVVKGKGARILRHFSPFNQ